MSCTCINIDPYFRTSIRHTDAAMPLTETPKRKLWLHTVSHTSPQPEILTLLTETRHPTFRTQSESNV